MSSAIQSASSVRGDTAHLANATADSQSLNHLLAATYAICLILTSGDTTFLRLLIYVFPFLYIFSCILEAWPDLRLQKHAIVATLLMLFAWTFSSLANDYITVSAKQYLFAILAPLTFIPYRKIDNTLVKIFTIYLIIAQAIFMAKLQSEGQLSLSFDILNTDSASRYLSESFVCFPLSAITLYYAMTRQYRWAIVTFIVVLLGLRRGAPAAAILGALTFLLSSRFPHLRGRLVLLPCFLLFIGAAIFSLNIPSIFSHDISLGSRGVGINQFTNGRFEVYQFIIAKVLSTPHNLIFGQGPGFSAELLESSYKNVGFEHPHNDFLKILLDNGSVGLFLIVLAYLAFIGTSVYSLPISAYIVALWLVDNTFIYYFHNAVLFLVIGALRQRQQTGASGLRA
jgi:O-antigen ligase